MTGSILNFQIRMMRQNHQQSRAGNSNAELVSSSVQGGVAGHNGRQNGQSVGGGSNGLNEIPLATNSSHLTVPSFQNSHLQNSGIQIKDSEIV